MTSEIFATRREVIKGGALALGLGAGALALGGCEALLKQIRDRPVRRNIATLAVNDPVVEAYRDAVSKMQALQTNSPSDPRGWANQANIHFSFCPHGNWFFLPWHRAYLTYFSSRSAGNFPGTSASRCPIGTGPARRPFRRTSGAQATA